MAHGFMTRFQLQQGELADKDNLYVGASYLKEVDLSISKLRRTACRRAPVCYLESAAL
jgi:hypothetical protein